MLFLFAFRHEHQFLFFLSNQHHLLPLVYVKDPFDEDSDNCYVLSIAHELYELFGGVNSYQAIEGLLETLSMLMICEEAEPWKTKRVIVFDNIEHFLSSKAIFDEEIIDLLDLINGALPVPGRHHEGFILAQNAHYQVGNLPLLSENTNKSYVFSDRVKMILAIRETSISMQAQRADEYDSKVDDSITIRDEIDISQIIRRKVNFLKNDQNEIRCDLSDKEPCKVMLAMLEDKPQFSSGLAGHLSRMYSYNKRRIIRNLINIFYYGASELPQQTYIMDYYRLRNKAKDFDLKTQGTLYNSYMSGSRELVMRLILDLIACNSRIIDKDKNRNYLEDLEVYKAGDRGSARQMMVFISRHPNYSPTEDNRMREDYQNATVKLSDLMHETFISPLTLDRRTKQEALNQFLLEKDAEAKLRQMAKKLNFMRQRFSYYQWAPLIILRFPDNGEITDETIFNCLVEICKEPSYEYEDKEVMRYLRYGVKSTIAGRFFVEITPTFEYFATRFFKQSKPLFFYKPLTDRDKLLSHIEGIKEKAFDCIADMIKKTDEYLSDGDNIYYNLLYSPDTSYSVQRLYRQFNFSNEEHFGMEYTHAARIIISHIGYLHNFKGYVIHELIGDIIASRPEIVDIQCEDVWDYEPYVNELLTVCGKDTPLSPNEQNHIEKVADLSLELLDVIGEI